MVKRLIILSLLIINIACGKEKVQSNIAKAENIKSVKTIELKSDTRTNIKNYNGELKPKLEMKIITPTGGDVEEIYFKNGDRVKKGEVIVKLSDANVKAAYYEAEGKLLKAKSTYSVEKISFEKYKKLYRKEIISEEDFLNVRNRYESAIGDLKIAEGNYIKAKDDYDRLNIKSQIDGIITDLYIKKYEKISSGTIVVTVVDNSEMELDIAVAGSDIKDISEDTQGEIYIEELGDKRVGRVKEINLNSDSKSKKYSIRLLVDNKDGKILKGMYAKVKLNQGDITGIFIPTKAIMIKELYSYIAIIREEKVNIYKVTPKLTLGDVQLVEFPEYRAGDRVVVEGQYLLNNNDRVKEN